MPLLGLLLRWRAALAFHQSPTAIPLGLDAAFYDRWARAGGRSGPPPRSSRSHRSIPPSSASSIALRTWVPMRCSPCSTPSGSAWCSPWPDRASTRRRPAGNGLPAGALGGDLSRSSGRRGLVALSASLIAYEHALLPEILGALLLTAGVGGLALAAGRGRITRARPPGAGSRSDSTRWYARRASCWCRCSRSGHWWRRRSAGCRARVLILLGAALAIAPVTLRNRVVGGEWVLVTAGGGFNFYIGNHAAADGGYVQPAACTSCPEMPAIPLGAAAERARGRTLTAGGSPATGAMRHGTSGARIRPPPAIFLRKMALVWTRAEIPQILHVAELRRDVARLRTLAAPRPRGPDAGSTARARVHALAGAAGCRLWRGHPGIHLVALALAGFTVATALFFDHRSFRIQAVPLLAISGALGGAALAHAVRRVRTRSRPCSLRGSLGLRPGPVRSE